MQTLPVVEVTLESTVTSSKSGPAVLILFPLEAALNRESLELYVDKPRTLLPGPASQVEQIQDCPLFSRTLHHEPLSGFPRTWPPKSPLADVYAKVPLKPMA